MITKMHRTYDITDWAYPVSKKDIIDRIQGEMAFTSGYIEESSVIVVIVEKSTSLEVYFQMYTVG